MQRSEPSIPHLLVVLIIATLTPILLSAKDAKISSDELVSKHLQSLGKIAGSETGMRVLQGKVIFSEIIGRNVHIEGTSTVLAQGRKFKCEFKFGALQYPGEQFIFDGERSIVAMIDPTSRSNLGTFLYTQDDILKSGLFGGTLSTGWPLLDMSKASAKLKYEGIHKVDGRELHDLLYTPKKRGGNGDLTIHLYFEPDTFRHVMTIYTLTLHNAAGNAVQGTDEVTQTLEEHFDDFEDTNGLILPRHWTLRYHVTPENKTQVFQWESTFQDLRVVNGN